MSATPEVLWRPPLGQRSKLSVFFDGLWADGVEVTDYESAWRWSVENPDAFWLRVWRYFDLPSQKEPDRALADASMPGAVWFPEVQTNYAEAMLRLPGRKDDEVVVHSLSQARGDVQLTTAQLREAVAEARHGLIERGVGPGDRVAAYAPNIAETLILMLASASVGAVFSSCAPEFGTSSVIDRLSQIEPTVLLVVDGYRYGTKAIDRTAEVTRLAAALPSVETLVWLPYLDSAAPVPVGAVSWAEFTSWSGPLEFEPVSFNHPLYVLFSSGTTGLPKAIVHGHGGIMLAHAVALGLQYDFGPRDVFYWFTTTGWMMWNYLISGLLTGSTIVMFDGDPAYPELDRTWEMVEKLGITQLGISAPFLMQCRKAGQVPKQSHDLSTLRGVGSTGSPLPVAGFEWVYEAIGSDLMLSSQSGGTDICGGFVGGSVRSPVYAGEIACKMLGVAVEAFDEAGHPVVGKQGELVVTSPMPNMPVGFWGDEDGSRFKAAYFETYPGVWHHGDWITFTERGTCTIGGRSDATLNRGGVRMGTAEFYAVVEELPEVADSLVVHLDDAAGGGTGTLWLFVVLAPGHLDAAPSLEKTLTGAIRRGLSPRHVPDKVRVVSAIPRTLSGKKMEIPVKKILQGASVEQVASKDAVQNAAALDDFVALREREVRT